MSDDGRVGASLGRRRLVLGWLLAVGGTAGLTALLLPFHRGAGPTFEAMLFLALAVGCALVGGLGPALGASVLGVLSLNFWFTEPVHTLDVASGLSVLTLVTYALVSAGVSSVVVSASRRQAQATAARAEADTLAGLNRTLLAGEHDVAGMLDVVRRTFRAEAAELRPEGQPLGPREVAVDASRHTVLVLRGADPDPAGRRVLAAFATHLGVLVQREELTRQTAAARELEAGNRTRTALLAAVSHDLRTPLAGLLAALGTLRLHDRSLAEPDRTELLEAAETSAARLSRMVADLLDMSRLQAGALDPLLTTVGAGEVVAAALSEIDDAARVRVSPDLPTVRCDVGLLRRVLVNVLGNAVRHTGGPVDVTGTSSGTRATLRIVDHGPGVAPGDREAMFEPFRRADDAVPDGVGLGLAVARGLTEAQGGTVHAEETPGGGLTMLVELAGA
jgi:two-component system sensor histidine kinase KdpD